MKKVCILCLLLALFLWGCGGEEAPGMSGAGTAEDPYRIETAAQLRRMGTLVNDAQTNEAYGGAVYCLAGDIALGGSAVWEPIGTAECPFRGTLEGNGHTISGIRIDYRDSLMGQDRSVFGLFGVLRGATVRDLSIGDSRLEATGEGYMRLAAVAADARDSLLENCHVADTVTLSSNYHTAGICAELNGAGILRNCTNAASVCATGKVGSAAGIVVRAETLLENCTNRGPILSEGDGAGIAITANGGMTDCRNEGAVTASGGYAAGILCRFGDGALNHRENNAEVTLLRCVNTGEIFSASDPAGGIAVRCSTGKLVDCRNEGTVTSPMETGGIFAYFNQSAFGAPCEVFMVRGCVNTGAVTNSEGASIYSVGGIGGILYGSSTEFLFENCENSGAVTSGEAAGGILGSGESPDIRLLGCKNSGTVTGVGVCGGIAGDLTPYTGEWEGDRVLVAERCRNEGTVYVRRDALNFGATVFLDSFAGGIVGRCWNLPTEPAFGAVSLTDCENTGPLDGENPGTRFWAHDLCGAWAAPEE